jgi:hypothetical protein
LFCFFSIYRSNIVTNMIKNVKISGENVLNISVWLTSVLPTVTFMIKNVKPRWKYDKYQCVWKPFSFSSFYHSIIMYVFFSFNKNPTCNCNILYVTMYSKLNLWILEIKFFWFDLIWNTKDGKFVCLILKH